jgi:hypothetical protein
MQEDSGGSRRKPHQDAGKCMREAMRDDGGGFWNFHSLSRRGNRMHHHLRLSRGLYAAGFRRRPAATNVWEDGRRRTGRLIFGVAR